MVRRRKFKETPRTLHAKITIEAYRKLESVAGNRSLGWAVEKLLEERESSCSRANATSRLRASQTVQ